MNRMLSNTKIKYIQSLYQKKKRGEEMLFIAEGVKIVNELLKQQLLQVNEVFATKEWMNDNQPLPSQIPVTEVTTTELTRISALTTPNQVLAVIRQPEPMELPSLPLPGITVALDGIQDPGNLGTIIRTCDWFGVSLIVCSEDCADVFNPKVIQATMGSFLRVQILYTPLDTFFATQNGASVYAAVLNGKPIDVTQPKPVNGILLIGNESRGIGAALEPFCTHRVSIQKKGGAESLNAAVACGVLLAQIT
jgi:RNA methyltransferase, TrmH family